MSHEALGPQFHEMTRGEFEQQPGTWWHGTQSGVIGHQGQSFHVGSRAAASEALAARIGRQHVPQEHQGEIISSHPTAQIHSGRIVSPMTNRPEISPSRGPGNRWEVREGIPRGEMADWPRRHPQEAMSDVRANAVEGGIRTRGQKMRRGIYYVNAGEGTHSGESPISAIVPNRAGFKTHHDYVSEALAQGKNVPQHVRNVYGL